MTPPIVWNYGGGWQTATIGVLIVEGVIPVPDFTLMADVGREDPATWAYLRDYMGSYLLRAGVQVRTLRAPDVRVRRTSVVLPVFTATGKMSAHCSGLWKRDTVVAELRRLGFGPKNPVLQWMGYSTDEAHRAKPPREKWILRGYPLLTMVPLRRDECLTVVRRAGLPDPPKSSCWQCPHRRNSQWLDLRNRAPALFAEAVAMDENLRLADDRDGVFLHNSRKPLASVDLTAADNGELFAIGCEGASCWT